MRSRARSALVGLALRQASLGTGAVAAVAAGMSGLVAVQYRTTFAEAMDDEQLRALAENSPIRILFGAPLALDDPGGFTVWRTGTLVLVLVAVWALLTASRVTREDEDAGRWDLLLGGRLRTVDLVATRLGTLSAGALLSGGAVTLALIRAGTDPTGAAVHGLGVAGAGLTFVAAAVLMAQLFPNRGTVLGASSVFVVAGIALRMLADSIDQMSWAAWLSPFGLNVLAGAYAYNRFGPVLVQLGIGVALRIAALTLARHRDVGGAVFAFRDSRKPRTWLLGSPTAFAVRRALAPTFGWVAIAAGYFLFVGAMIAAILRFFAENPRFPELASAAGFSGLETANGLAAALFQLLAVVAGLYAATRIATLAADESARRWTSLLALPLSRARLAGTEILVTVTGCLLVLVSAACALWAGAALGGAELGLPEAVAGALNVAPIAFLGAGAATAALGSFPRHVGAIGAIPVLGGFVLDAVAQSVAAPEWVSELSPFAHLAPVPTSSPDWPASLVLTGISCALAVVGFVGYRRRDLYS